MHHQSLYQVLEVKPSATKDEIRRQYKRLALKYHPDKNADASVAGKGRAEEAFKAISKAYEILSNDDARKHYDLYGDEAAGDVQQEGQPSGGDNPRASYGTRRAGGPSPSSYQEDARGGQRRATPSSFGFEGFGRDDPFAASPQWRRAERAPPAGAHGRMPSLFEAFAFRDPFELFEQMMADEFGAHMFDDDDFFGIGGMRRSNNRQQQHHRQHAPSGSMNLMGASPMMMQMMGGMHDDMSMLGFHHGGRGGGMGLLDDFFNVGYTSHRQGQQQQQRRSSGSGAVMQSVSTVTEIRNGQRVTKTVRRTQNADGVVTEDVDEEVAMMGSGPRNHHHHHHAPLPPLSATRGMAKVGGGGSQQQARDAMLSYSYY